MWSRTVLAFAFVLALPAYLLTHESFEPIDERFQLVGGGASHTFDLRDRAPLFLEYALTLRAEGDTRPPVALELNGTRVAVLRNQQLFAPERGKVLLLFAPVRRGENRLRLVIDGPAQATAELEARLHNYSGIAPDFPRVFVVADEAVSQATAERPPVVRAIRFGAFYLLSLPVVWGIRRLSGRRRFDASGMFMAASPSFVLWAAAGYGFATPLHIWLSPGALLVSAAAGWALAAWLLWIAAHRVGVIRWAGPAVVSLVLLEVALRLFNHVSPSFVFYSDAYSRYRGQPGEPFYDSRFNSRGFNDVEHPLEKPANVARRIVALGDSVALGVVPYRANFLTLLEPALASDGSVEVVKMGVAATEPIGYLAILVKDGLAFHPDLVLTTFFIGNDFEVPGRKAHEYSYVAMLAHAAWRLWSAGKPAVASAHGRGAEYRDDEPSLTQNRFLEIEVDRSWVYAGDSAALAAATSRVAGQLREMRDISRRAGADFAVVVVPDEMQVNDALQAEVVRASGLGRDRFDFQLPNRLMTEALAKDGIPVLDLLPAFREAARRERVYKPQDTHWNLAGNRLAAETIAAFLRDRWQRR